MKKKTGGHFWRRHIDKVAVDLGIFFVVAMVIANIIQNKWNQYLYLAESFFVGKLHFIQGLDYVDEPSIFQGLEYWPLGPFPAVLLMPFVAMAELADVIIHQGFVNIVCVCATFVVIYFLSRKLSYKKSDALFLTFTFGLCSPFIYTAITPASYYFAHNIVVLVLFLALLEFFGARRYWLIGVLCSVALATRVTAGFGAIFFVLFALLESKPWLARARNIAAIIFPIAIVVLFLVWYNFARFGDPLETGYSHQLVPDLQQQAIQDVGQFSVQHLPRNAYHMLLGLPKLVVQENTAMRLEFPFFQSDPWGMSIFFVSPFLIYLFFFRWKSRKMRLLLLTSIMIAIPFLFIRSVGFRQYGYRYALDFLPFLYVALLIGCQQRRKTLSFAFKVLMIISALVNFYLILVPAAQ